MGSYQYKARDKSGKPLQGLMDAASGDDVASRLKDSGLMVISINPVEEKKVVKFLERFRKVKMSDLNMFTRQFYVLQKAGLPILSTFTALAEQTESPMLKAALEGIGKDVKSGTSLSDALKKYPKIFSSIYLSMVEVGEASGTLDEVLERLAVLGENEEGINMRVKAATRYPVFVVVAIVIAFLVLTTFVVPRFASIFSKSGVELPLPTKILVWLNYSISHYWWLMIIIIGALIFAFQKFINTEKGRIYWDSFKLKVPVFGPLTLLLAMSRFARITGTLMRTGVHILRILDLSASGSGNVIISRAILSIKSGISEGRHMDELMKQTGMFPPAVVQMVSAGEKTGKLDELLLHVSNYYDSQADYTISNLTTLIEPMLIFGLGCGVLFMALGIFLPMWNMMALFQK